jgi:rubrerythrin
MNKQTRYSFSKNNMNAAIAMRTNAYGQTVLGDAESPRGEHIDVDDTPPDAEFQPHIGPNGEFVHNQSVINSPTLQRFFENYSRNLDKSTPAEVQESTPEEQPQVNMLNSEYASVTDIDAYAKEFADQDEPELSPEPTVKQAETKAKRTFASRSLVRFCTECGFSFNSEKFCPHCGQKRATYSAPNA